MKIKKFKDWSIQLKILSISIFTIVFVLSGIQFYLMPFFKDKLMSEKMSMLQNVTNVAYSIVNTYENRMKSGEMNEATAKKEAMNSLNKIRYAGDEYFWINDLEPKMVMHPINEKLNGTNVSDYKDPTGKKLFVEFTEVAKSKGEGFVNYVWQKPGQTVTSPKLSYVKHFAPWGWVVGSGIYIDDVEAQIGKMRSTILIVSLVCMVLVFLLAFIVAGIITRPLQKAVEVSNMLADGNLDITIAADTKDETGKLLTAMGNMVEKLKTIVTEIRIAAGNIASGSQQMSDAAIQVSHGASEQAASAEETSSSMEEMSSNIQRNADNASETEKIAVKSSMDAQEGGKAVNETVKAMKKIADDITIVEEIARQTNMLALNAAIEAARAGEHGKGFAVVAAEVRKLAERSQVAAEEIRLQSAESVKVAESAFDVLSKMVPNIQKTSELVQEISTASNEQNSGADQINQAIQQLDSVIQQNAGVAEEMASTAEELSSQAVQMQQLISFFKLKESEQSSANSIKREKTFVKTGSSGAGNNYQSRPKQSLKTIKTVDHKDFIDLSAEVEADSEYIKM